ncbi:Chromatin-remodeling complexes subunit ngg1 [Schizosaccharomyces pombe]
MSSEQQNEADSKPAVIPQCFKIENQYETFSRLSETSTPGVVPSVSTLWRLLFELQKMIECEPSCVEYFRQRKEELESHVDSKIETSKDESSVNKVEEKVEEFKEDNVEQEIKQKRSLSESPQESMLEKVYKKPKVSEAHNEEISPENVETIENELDLPVKGKDEQTTGLVYKNANDLLTGSLLSFIVDDSFSYEQKKKLLCVDSFPTSDVRSLVAGTPATDDFSHNKPNNQISISTFYSSLEPYFRAFNDDDIAFLKKGFDVSSSYNIPPLGERYYDLTPEDEMTNLCANSIYQNLQTSAQGSLEAFNEADTVSEEVRCGPLTERLMASLIPCYTQNDEEQKPSIAVGEFAETDSGSEKSKIGTSIDGIESGNNEYTEQPDIQESSLSICEDRLRYTLKQLGILYDGDVDWSKRQDDEISATLRSLNARLKVVSDENEKMRNALLQMLPEEMAFQEFQNVMDDLDKQIEQAYVKRNRSLKVKKKRIVTDKIGSSATSGSFPVIKSLMDKRSMWLEKLQPLFQDKLTQHLGSPTSIFNDLSDHTTSNYSTSV